MVKIRTYRKNIIGIVDIFDFRNTRQQLQYSYIFHISIFVIRDKTYGGTENIVHINRKFIVRGFILGDIFITVSIGILAGTGEKIHIIRKFILDGFIIHGFYCSVFFG